MKLVSRGLLRTIGRRSVAPFPRHLSTTSNNQPPTEPKESKPSLLDQTLQIAPGVVAAAAVMQGGYFAAEHLGQLLLQAQGITENCPSPISGIPCSILLGLAINNLSPVSLPSSLKPGLTFATKPLLQLGIVCVGAKLSAIDLFSTGLVGIPAVAASITMGLTFVPWFARKMDLPHKMGLLIAAGTSICGVTAITALAPAIKANKQETSFAVANVVAFGTLGMLTYPYLAHQLLDSSHQIGMFLGLAVHDTSQVIGSALTYSTVYGDEEVLRVAAVTKLTRNICLAGVIPGLTFAAMRHEQQAALAEKGEAAQGGKAPMPSFDELKKYVPAFVLGFVGMSMLRSGGDYTLAEYGSAYGALAGAEWDQLTTFVGNKLGSHYCLGTAMAAVGLTTSMSALKGVGARPFVVGLAGAAAVGGTGLATTVLLSQIVPGGI